MKGHALNFRRSERSPGQQRPAAISPIGGHRLPRLGRFVHGFFNDTFPASIRHEVWLVARPEITLGS
jgi:hypothetical protein